jgi:hypothetical protein
MANTMNFRKLLNPLICVLVGVLSAALSVSFFNPLDEALCEEHVKSLAWQAGAYKAQLDFENGKSRIYEPTAVAGPSKSAHVSDRGDFEVWSKPYLKSSELSEMAAKRFAESYNKKMRSLAESAAGDPNR